jgi:hypothetical protein
VIPARDGAGARLPAPASPSGGAVVPVGGVNTLRAILLGGSPRIPEDARLTAIERRLDTLSLQLAREPRAAGDLAVPIEPPVDGARLAEIERRLEAHDARLDGASAGVRGGDVTLASLEALRQQVDTLRDEHTQLADQTASRLREADARCQLRQLRVRTARRQELLRLRRRVYAHGGVVSSALNGAASQPDTAAPPASALGVAAPRAADAPPPPVWPVTLASQPHAAPVAGGGAAPLDDKSRHAAMRRDLDLEGARHAMGGSLAALLRSLATLIVVSGRLAGNDLRALWAWLTHSRHAADGGGDRDQRGGPFSK